MSNSKSKQPLLSGRLLEDDYYDMVKGFLTEARDVPVAYVVERDGSNVFIDPNTGTVMSDDVSDWDETDYEKFFRRWGTNTVNVRDPIGPVRAGEYSRQSFMRKLAAPKRAKTFQVVKGEKLPNEALKLSSSLITNKWPGVK